MTPSAAVVHRTAERAISRPLKVLVPLIQADLEHATSAGLQYYLAAGAKLIEAKESGQIAHGSWGPWLNRNFKLSQVTARRYMRAARADEDKSTTSGRSLLALTGEREQRKEHRANQRDTWKRFDAAIADVDVEAVKQAKQTVADEVSLHRTLALELIDIGYKALATRLHPDRGGKRDAMSRLNRVRDELKEVAATRRFV